MYVFATVSGSKGRELSVPAQNMKILSSCSRKREVSQSIPGLITALLQVKSLSERLWQESKENQVYKQRRSKVIRRDADTILCVKSDKLDTETREIFHLNLTTRGLDLILNDVNGSMKNKREKGDGRGSQNSNLVTK